MTDAATPTNDSTPTPDAEGAPEAAPALDPAQVVQSALGDISHIATLPEVTMKIIQLVEDPESTAQDLNKVISNDPALGARILKVVNSAFYGLPGQIGSINRAIVLLGLNAVKNIAIAASLAKLFRGGKISPNFDAKELWMHSIACATGTRLLSDKIGLGLPDEAFLAGLIHNLGIMVEIQAKRPQFIEAIELMDREGLTLREAERRAIGADHEQFGTGLCKAWKFPQSFANVAGFHHRPWELPANCRKLAMLVYLADVIAAHEGFGWAGGTEDQELNMDVVREVGLDVQMINEVIAAMPEAIDEAQALLDGGGA